MIAHVGVLSRCRVVVVAVSSADTATVFEPSSRRRRSHQLARLHYVGACAIDPAWSRAADRVRTEQVNTCRCHTCPDRWRSARDRRIRRRDQQSAYCVLLRRGRRSSYAVTLTVREPDGDRVASHCRRGAARSEPSSSLAWKSPSRRVREVDAIPLPYVPDSRLTVIVDPAASRSRPRRRTGAAGRGVAVVVDAVTRERIRRQREAPRSHTCPTLRSPCGTCASTCRP